METTALLEDFQWRYATKKFDETKKLTDAQLATILEAGRLAPSSFGIQPWKFVVVTDSALRQKLAPAAFNQSQITAASHLVVLCVPKEFTTAHVDSYMADMAATRGISVESLAGFRAAIVGSMTGKSSAEVDSWVKKQLYIALGFMLSTAAHLHIDACPMEGFNPQQFDEILGLSDLGLQSVVLCALGFRAADDKDAERKKVRFPISEIVIKK